MESGDYFFDRWPKQFTGAALFDGDPHYAEPVQGGAGTCYIMQAISGVAEFPALIKDVFLTQESNKAGIHGIKLYIRGKPWVLAVDDNLLFIKGTDSSGRAVLKFAQPDADFRAMWAPILEKAWAKVKGAYQNADGGMLVNGLRAVTGCPTFYYRATSIGLKKSNGDYYTYS